MTCLGYYLTHYKKTAQFKAKSLVALNSEAAQPPFSNASVAVDNASKSQYLTQAGGGDKQITARGEALVEALPDRGAVKSALEANPLVRRHKKRSKKTHKATK